MERVGTSTGNLFLGFATGRNVFSNIDNARLFEDLTEPLVSIAKEDEGDGLILDHRCDARIILIYFYQDFSGA